MSQKWNIFFLFTENISLFSILSSRSDNKQTRINVLYFIEMRYTCGALDGGKVT